MEPGTRFFDNLYERRRLLERIWLPFALPLYFRSKFCSTRLSHPWLCAYRRRICCRPTEEKKLGYFVEYQPEYSYLFASPAEVRLEAKETKGFIAENAGALAVASSTALHVRQTLGHLAARQVESHFKKSKNPLRNPYLIRRSSSSLVF